jgi:hypothetical protein
MLSFRCELGQITAPNLGTASLQKNGKQMAAFDYDAEAELFPSRACAAGLLATVALLVPPMPFALPSRNSGPCWRLA